MKRYFCISDGRTREVKQDKAKGILIRCIDCETINGWSTTTEAHIKSMVGFGLFKEVKE